MAAQPVPEQQPLVTVQTFPPVQPPPSASGQVWMQARPCDVFCTQLSVAEQPGAASPPAASLPPAESLWLASWPVRASSEASIGWTWLSEGASALASALASAVASAVLPPLASAPVSALASGAAPLPVSSSQATALAASSPVTLNIPSIR